MLLIVFLLEIHIINIQMMRIQKYDQCGELVSGFDVQPGTFISREAFITIDSRDDVIAFHSYSQAGAEDNPCHIVKVSGNMDRVLWDDVINSVRGNTSWQKLFNEGEGVFEKVLDHAEC